MDLRTLQKISKIIFQFILAEIDESDDGPSDPPLWRKIVTLKNEKTANETTILRSTRRAQIGI